MRIIKIIVYLIIILLGITFAALNAKSVQVNLYIATLSLPISVLMVIMLGLGLLIGFVVCFFKFWQYKIETSKIQRQLKITEKEIKNLRDIPVKDQH